MTLYPKLHTCLVGLLLLGLSGELVPVAAAPPPGDPAGIFSDARKQLKRRKIAEAVRGLRSILRDHPKSEHVKEATELLAAHGYGLDFEVAFDSRKALEKFGLSLSEMVHASARIRGEMNAFFKQIDADHKPPYLQIVVLDSRNKYRKEYKRATRRSVVEKLKPKKGSDGRPRARIGVYYDVRISNQKDILRALHVSLARAVSQAMRDTPVNGAVPRSLESGVSDYLSVRLFPERYQSRPRSPEDILQSYARQGLAQLANLKKFEQFLFGKSPGGKGGPGRQRRWVGLSYALIDVLIRGEFGKASGEKGKGVPRNKKVQAFLRDYAVEERARQTQKGGDKRKRNARRDARDARELLETLLRRHFEIGIAELHKAYVAHVQSYTIGESDAQGLQEI